MTNKTDTPQKRLTLAMPLYVVFDFLTLVSSFCKIRTEQVGSAKLLEEPSLPGSGYKALDREGFDDGGVADLTLVIDLEDSVLRRKRGENEYFSALKADLLPRVTRGPMAQMTRREQKSK